MGKGELRVTFINHATTLIQLDGGQFEAVYRLELALDKEPEPKPQFLVLGFGEGRDVPPLIQ